VTQKLTAISAYVPQRQSIPKRTTSAASRVDTPIIGSRLGDNRN
jgi:hypothetical protein